MKPFVGVIDGVQKYPFLEPAPDGKSHVRSVALEIRIVCDFPAGMSFDEMRKLIGTQVAVAES